MKANIFLIGFSGTGKSSSGRLAARRLGWKFLDTDEVIAAHTGLAVAEIFERHGEPLFRRLERKALEQAAAGSRRVVSTGGGAPVDPRNRDLMRRTGMRVLLRASPETIHERLANSRNPDRRGSARPLLGAAVPVERIKGMLIEREEAYMDADAVVDTDGRRSYDVAMEIVSAWQRFASAPAEHPEP